MGCIPSKASDPKAVRKTGADDESGHVNGNGVDNDSDTDSVAKFLAQVKGAQKMDEIYNGDSYYNSETRDSLTGNLSLYMAKKRESISASIRECGLILTFSVYLDVDNFSFALFHFLILLDSYIMRSYHFQFLSL